MNSDSSLKPQLIALLREQEDAVCQAWTQRLGEAAQLAGRKLGPGPTGPMHRLMRDLIDALDGKLTELEPEPLDQARKRLGPMMEWRINLCQAVEVLLTGEVVVRFWARAHLDADEAQLLELFEQINGAFHQLLRLYTLRYCDHCHAWLTASAGDGTVS